MLHSEEPIEVTSIESPNLIPEKMGKHDFQVQILNKRKLKDKPCSCRRVLIVEDEIFNVDAASRMLAALNYDVIAVYNGQDAINKLSTIRLQNYEVCDSLHCRLITLIFMDCNMQPMDGWTTTRKIVEQ